MNLSKKEEKAIKEFADELHKRFGELIVEVKLFGSKAHGDSNKLSDIDIFVVVKKFDWDQRSKISEVANDVSLKYDVVISDIIFSIDEMNNNVIRATPFVQNVEREGIRIE